jgi:uncharacterized membrane protein YdbT with pleckstrin-like domain
MARVRGSFWPVLAVPDDIVQSYLVTGERVIHVDRPALDAFLIIQWPQVLLALASTALFVWLLVQGETTWAFVVFLVLDALLIWLVLKRLGDFYTRYVVTTLRVMRVSGVLARHCSSIPWIKVTDISFHQTLLGRMFGYATVKIESANEDSGFRALSDLKDPARFNRILVEMVAAKQGAVAPSWASVTE